MSNKRTLTKTTFYHLDNLLWYVNDRNFRDKKVWQNTQSALHLEKVRKVIFREDKSNTQPSWLPRPRNNNTENIGKDNPRTKEAFLGLLQIHIYSQRFWRTLSSLNLWVTDPIRDPFKTPETPVTPFSPFEMEDFWAVQKFLGSGKKLCSGKKYI